MELGIYRLAEINAGGGLRQKSQGTAGQYLNGEGAWTTFPTALAPTAHSHSASEITEGTLALARIPTGTGSNQVALGNHTHLYAGSSSAGGPATTALACTGNAATATKLATARTLTIGNTGKDFDGSQPVSWTLAEIGANQWQYGQYGDGSIKTNAATATGLRSGDGAKPYVYWGALAGQDLKAGGLAGTDQKWMLISPMTVATYAYGGVEYTYNNATANYVFLILINSADFIGSATSPFNVCRIIANAGTNYLSSYRAILTVGSPITGNVYPVIVSTGSSTAPAGIVYTDPVRLYAPLKSSDGNYTGLYSVASGAVSVASGDCSVASGLYSVASGHSSVASGRYSVASGNASVASGYASIASGYASVASGNNSVASGAYSVASGAASVASGDSQTVIGKYNVANTSSAFIIGNGTSTSARSNCMTVDFSGNMTLAGALTLSNRAGANRIAYFDSAGTLQSSALYNLNSFALATHNHNSDYAAIGHNHSGTYATTDHTHLYAGSATAGGPATTALACTGNAATATKLATARTLTIGNTGKDFDGSQPVSWTLAEIGANQWQYGQYGDGSIKTNAATATGLRSGDGAKPYVYWGALAGQDLKAGGLAGTDQKWMLISPMTVATYAYGGVEYTYNNATANYVFLILINSADFIGSATSPFNVCRIIANAGTNYLSSYRAILTVGSPITGNVYPVIVSTGSSTAPAGIVYTDPVRLYAPLKSSDGNYTGLYSVASGAVSVASGDCSVASGLYSVASGHSSVASGRYSVASGNASVASGYASIASGYASVASGNNSVASGAYSVASGAASVASGYSQTVVGKYNVANTSSAFIIGNGTSTSARSNCMTVDFSGNMTLAGSIAIGATGDLTLSKHAGLNRLAYFDASGVVQSDASILTTSFAAASHNHDGVYSLAAHTHSAYSQTTHNHDSTYLKLSGGTVTGRITLDTNGGIFKSGWEGNRIAYFVSGDLTTSSDYTLSSFALATHNHDGVYSPTSHTHSGYALATHNHDSAYSAIGHDHSGTYAAASHTHSGYAATSHLHSIPDLYCGVPYIVSGRLLISGSGASSNPTWMEAGTTGKILGWASGAPAWVDAPSGSSVSAANPTASVGLAAVNGSAATFMRSDAAPKLDVSIAPTWTGAHTFNGLTRFSNVGIGVAPNAAYKLYIEENKTINVAGSYIGSYIVAKYNTGMTSGTRQGIALLGQLHATGGTLTNAKGLDFKVYVPSGTVTEATAINAVIQTDGGSIGTAYALKLSRLGTAPTVANYGIWQDDSTATNVFKGPCQFDGGTDLLPSGTNGQFLSLVSGAPAWVDAPSSGGGRVRNFRTMSASGTINHESGTDTLVIATNSTSEAALGLPTTATTGDRIEVYSTTYNAYFTCPSAKILPVQYEPNDSSGLVTSWGSSSGGSLYGIGAPAYCFAIWDGTYWRVGYLNPQY